MWCVCCVLSITCLISHISSLWNLFSLIQSDHVFKIIFGKSLIRALHTSYAPQFPLIVMLKKHKSIFSSETISQPSIILYLWFTREFFTWKLHVKIFLVSYLESTFYTLLVWLLLKSPTCVPQRTGLLFFLANIVYVNLL